MRYLSAGESHGLQQTAIRGAGRLRQKETERLMEIHRLLSSFGARCQVRGDDLQIEGGHKLRPAAFSSSDHRLVMAAAIMAAAIKGDSRVGDLRWAGISYPEFATDFAKLAAMDYNFLIGGMEKCQR